MATEIEPKLSTNNRNVLNDRIKASYPSSTQLNF